MRSKESLYFVSAIKSLCRFSGRALNCRSATLPNTQSDDKITGQKIRCVPRSMNVEIYRSIHLRRCCLATWTLRKLNFLVLWDRPRNFQPLFSQFLFSTNANEFAPCTSTIQSSSRYATINGYLTSAKTWLLCHTTSRPKITKE